MDQDAVSGGHGQATKRKRRNDGIAGLFQAFGSEAVVVEDGVMARATFTTGCWGGGKDGVRGEGGGRRDARGWGSRCLAGAGGCQRRARRASAWAWLGWPTAALMRGLMDLFAQYERAVIGSRTRAALAINKAKRERVGGIPFGFRLDVDGKRLSEDAYEQPVIVELLTLRPSMSLRALAAHCEREGIVARNGAWSPTTLSRLFRRLAAEEMAA